MSYRLFIKDYRKSRKMTQKELANKSNIDQSYISRLENNSQNLKSPTLTVIFDIAAALNVCPHMLIRYDYSCIKNCCYYCNKFF